MSVDDHGLEVLKKSGEEVVPGSKADYYIKVAGFPGAPPLTVILVDDATTGEELFLSNATVSTPNADQILISHTVGAGLTLNIQSAIVKYANYSKFYVKVNGSVVGSGRTGPAKGQDSFEWDRIRYPAVSGDLVELVFRAYGSTPIDDVEAYIIGIEQ